jgi:1-acyl-sn-glycerol-3-phosphate acyltransferase
MKIIKSFYTLYSALIFAVLMLLFGIFIVFPLILSSKGAKVSFVFIRLWAGTWAFLSGIRYEIHGKEFIDPKQPYIYIFNHRSFIDAPLIPLAISQEIRAIGKKELSKIPLFGTVVGRFAVWVDRANPESRKESLVKLLAILKTGQSIVVAPEGTRNDTKERLLPFQKGAFRLSIETQIPIMPIAFIGAENIMKRGSLLLSPGKVRIYFSTPISPPQQSEHAIEEFSEKCKNRLDAMILAHE